MNRIVRLFGALLFASAVFSASGCKEDVDLPPEDPKPVMITALPSEDPTFEEAVKYAVNLGPRGATKPRQIAMDALDKVEKKVKAETPVDAKKLEQIKACKNRIAALGDYLRDIDFYAKYISAKTSPDVSQEDIIAKMEKAKDPEYLKLKKFSDESTKKNEAAFKKMMDLCGEYKENNG